MNSTSSAVSLTPEIRNTSAGDRAVVVTFKQPVSGIDLEDGKSFVSDRHKVMACSIRQDNRSTVLINDDGELMGRWPTALVAMIEWPSQRSASVQAARQKSDWSAKLVDIRKRFPNAFRRWTEDQETVLREMFSEGRSVRQMSEDLGRGTGGIISRLVILGLVDDGSTEMQVDIASRQRKRG